MRDDFAPVVMPPHPTREPRMATARTTRGLELEVGQGGMTAGSEVGGKGDRARAQVRPKTGHALTRERRGSG